MINLPHTCAIENICWCVLLCYCGHRDQLAHAVIVAPCSTPVPACYSPCFTSHHAHRMPGHAAALRRLAATTKHTHHHRRPVTINNRQPQTATRHVPPLTPCERSRVVRRVCRVAGPLFHGGNAIVFGRFLGVTEITPPLKPIPRRPVVAFAQFPGGNTPARDAWAGWMFSTHGAGWHRRWLRRSYRPAEVLLC
jgi:hypothetical protein